MSLPRATVLTLRVRDVHALAVCATLVLSALGCSDSDVTKSEDAEQHNPSLATDARALEPDREAGVGTCTEGTSEPCSCPSAGTGRRLCRDATFGACEGCTTPSTSATLSKCVAGHYVGRVHASYVPTPAGLCGLVTLFGGEGSATLEFDLEATSGEIFSVIGNTCIELAVQPSDAGVTDEFAQMAAQKIGLRGQVDCNSGEFSGEVRGTYSAVSICNLGLEKNDYFFKGPVTGRFDPEQRAFTAGRMILREPPVLLALGGEAGGEASWTAQLVPDAGKSPARGDCLGGLRFPDELFPTSGDAGP